MKGGFEISVGRWEAGDEGRLGCFQVPSCRRASSWEERLEPVNPARGRTRSEWCSRSIRGSCHCMRTVPVVVSRDVSP